MSAESFRKRILLENPRVTGVVSCLFAGLLWLEVSRVVQEVHERRPTIFFSKDAAVMIPMLLVIGATLLVGGDRVPRIVCQPNGAMKRTPDAIAIWFVFGLLAVVPALGFHHFLHSSGYSEQPRDR